MKIVGEIKKQENETIQFNFDITAEQKKKLDEIKEDLGIQFQAQGEHALDLWFEKAEKLKKELKK